MISRRLHFLLVLGLIMIFLIGVGVGLSQKTLFSGNLFNKPVISSIQSLQESAVLEVKDVSVNPENSILTYTITRESQVTVWIENADGNVLKIVRPAAVMSAGVFQEKWPEEVIGDGDYYFVIMAVDAESDNIVSHKSRVMTHDL